MNVATEKIIRAAIESDRTITADESNAAIAILHGRIPEKPPASLLEFIRQSKFQVGPIHVEPQSVNPYLRRREAAKYLRCSVRQLDEMKHRGELPFHRFGRRLIVFKTTDLDALIEKRRIDVKRQ